MKPIYLVNGKMEMKIIETRNKYSIRICILPIICARFMAHTFEILPTNYSLINFKKFFTHSNPNKKIIHAAPAPILPFLTFWNRTDYRNLRLLHIL